MLTDYPPHNEMLKKIDGLLSMERDDDERWTAYSFVDNYAKYLSTLNDHGQKIEELFALCRKHGYIPQYNISGPAVFIPTGTLFNDSAKFMMTPDQGGIMLSSAGVARAIVFLFHKGCEKCPVYMSPSTNRLAAICVYDNASHVVLWDLESLKIVTKVRTEVRDICWGADDALYYIDTEYLHRVSADGTDSELCQMAVNISRFCVNEPLGKVLSINSSALFVDDMDAGTYEEYEMEFEPDSTLSAEEDGFRVFSGDELYAVIDTVELIKSVGKPCRARDGIDIGRFHPHYPGTDFRGTYLIDGNIKCYFNGQGEVTRICRAKKELMISPDSLFLKNQWAAAIHAPVPRDGGESVIQQPFQSEEIISKLRKEKKVVFANRNGEICAARYAGEIRNRRPKADIIVFGEIGKYPSLRPGSIIDSELIDFDKINFDFPGEYAPRPLEADFSIDAKVLRTNDLSPVGKVFLAVSDLDHFRESLDGDHCTLCAYLDYSGIVISTTDGDRCSVIRNELDMNWWMRSISPLIVQDREFYTVRPDGKLQKFDFVSNPDDLRCYGNGALWRSGDRYYLNDQEITATIGNHYHNAALVSDDTLVFPDSAGWNVYYQGDEEKTFHPYDELAYWNILGLSDRHYLCMCHYELKGDVVTVRFAELNVRDGSWNETDKAITFSVPTYDLHGYNQMALSIFDYVDFRKQRILQVDRYDLRSSINRYDLSKGNIVRNNNALRSNITKKWLRPRAISGHIYVIMTTELNDEDTVKKDAQENVQSMGLRGKTRPEIRIMDSAKGTRVSGKGRSGGIMYGPPGVYLSDTVCRTMLSPEGDVLFVHYEGHGGLQAFDLPSQKTYPESGPIIGQILTIEPSGKLIVAVPDGDNRYALRQEFDYHLNPLIPPEKMIAEVNVWNSELRYTLLNETVDGKYKVTPAGQQYMPNRLTSLIKYRGNTLERKKPSVILCHFRDGLTENEREYAIINPDKMEWFGDLSATLGHNLLVNSSSELLAVFEVSSVTVKDSETPVQVTLFYGDTSKQIEVQNPFELNGARECPVCPVWVSGNRYAYARDVGGKARVELHEICSDGTDGEIKSIDVDDYCIPIFADESLIILYSTSEKKVKYSTDWEETEYAVGKDIDPWSGVMEYISCENGVYEFANSLHRYTFSSGHFDMIDTNDKPQELRLENGTLRWKYGVVILEN